MGRALSIRSCSGQTHVGAVSPRSTNQPHDDDAGSLSAEQTFVAGRGVHARTAVSERHKSRRHASMLRRRLFPDRQCIAVRHESSGSQCQCLRCDYHGLLRPIAGFPQSVQPFAPPTMERRRNEASPPKLPPRKPLSPDLNQKPQTSHEESDHECRAMCHRAKADIRSR